MYIFQLFLFILLVSLLTVALMVLYSIWPAPVLVCRNCKYACYFMRFIELYFVFGFISPSYCKYDLRVCDDGKLVHILCSWTLSIVSSLSKMLTKHVSEIGFNLRLQVKPTQSTCLCWIIQSANPVWTSLPSGPP
jgi:hypothetical protein